jgi:hypothetical protein
VVTRRLTWVPPTDGARSAAVSIIRGPGGGFMVEVRHRRRRHVFPLAFGLARAAVPVEVAAIKLEVAARRRAPRGRPARA